MIKKAFKSGFGMVTSILGSFKKMSKISIITATAIGLIATGFGIFTIIRRRDNKNGKIKDSQGK